MIEEKVEMADVPLTTAVDGEHMTENTEEKEKKGMTGAKHRFSLANPFTRKHVSAVTKTEEEATKQEAKSCEKTNKQPRHWFTFHNKHYDQMDNAETKEETTTVALNLMDRDEKNINDHVKLSFEDVLAEPDSSHSLDCTWRLTHRVFTNVQKVVYRFLALILALPCAIVWAVILAVLTSIYIWICTPLLAVLSMPFNCLFKVWSFLVRSTLDPLFHSAGLCVNSIQIRRTNVCLNPQVCP
ncbi:unnamed protein product [Soboliphyme baturini]|uniref:Caveolin n=1 Tax=Soboliphyme baturini TaxID=241478 RepID=A0A183IFH8_9BILA|nr:unnamed protein product [Soboliphyme baturini]